MQLEPNMYVRTISGIERLKKENENGWFFSKRMILKPDNLSKYIIKASHNIIDLIEVGDYVNGHKITNIAIQKRLLYTEDAQIIIRPENIKSIVTKEQFEAMQYKVV